MEFIRNVWKLINSTKRHIGIYLTFLALIMKYKAPKTALPASSTAGSTLAYWLPILKALGSIIMQTHPTRAKSTPIISLFVGRVPAKTPIKTMNNP